MTRAHAPRQVRAEAASYLSALDARDRGGSVHWPCIHTTARPPHAGFASVFGASVSDAALRRNPVYRPAPQPEPELEPAPELVMLEPVLRTYYSFVIVLVDVIFPYKVRDAKCLNQSMLTRARAPRQAEPPAFRSVGSTGRIRMGAYHLYMCSHMATPCIRVYRLYLGKY